MSGRVRDRLSNSITKTRKKENTKQASANKKRRLLLLLIFSFSCFLSFVFS